nr:hypothetical protein [Abalone asfa-like virus]
MPGSVVHSETPIFNEDNTPVYGYSVHGCPRNCICVLYFPIDKPGHIACFLEQVACDDNCPENPNDTTLRVPISPVKIETLPIADCPVEEIRGKSFRNCNFVIKIKTHCCTVAVMDNLKEYVDLTGSTLKLVYLDS